MMDQEKNARATIVSAFNRLVLAKRQLKPRVADVLSEAGVARSTFYEHFTGRDSLLITAMRGPLSVIADAATGNGDMERLSKTLAHFRENRRGAMELLTGALSARIVRTLAELIGERLHGETATSNIALHLAESQLGFVRLWISGETVYAPQTLATMMIRSADAIKAVLSDPSD
jgi:AcrR family transcriptional regulator